MSPRRRVSPIPATLGLAALFLLVLGTIAVILLRTVREQVLSAARETISAIADARAHQIADWYLDHMGDAEAIAVAPLGDEVRLVASSSDDGARDELQQWLDSFRTANRYTSCSLIEPAGNVLLSTDGEGSGLTSAMVQEARLSLEDDRIHVLDLHRPVEDGPVLLAFFVPFADALHPAVLVLLVDAADNLFPLLESWPTPSATGETLIVRRLEKEALVLSPLQYMPGAELEHRFSLSPHGAPAARAALGLEGVYDGVDYRGHDVISATRRIEGTEWFLVAKVDRDEIELPFRRRRVVPWVMVVLLSVAMAAGVALSWSRRELRVTELQLQQTREAEAALRDSESRFRRAVSDSPLPTMIHAEDGEVLQVNDAWCEGTGYTPAELPTIREWTRLAYDDERAKVEALIESLYGREHRAADGDFTVRTRTGELRVWDFNSSPIGRHADGRRLVMSVAVDVTERRRAERALAESEEHFRLALGGGSIIIFYQDRDLRYTWAHNPRPDFEPDRVLGKRDEDLLAPAEAARLTAIKREVLATGKMIREEVQVTIAGVCADYLLMAEPRRDGDEIAGVACTAVDITNLKNAERQNREQLAELRAWQAVTLERESRVLDLKREVNDLLSREGLPPRYASADTDR